MAINKSLKGIHEAVGTFNTISVQVGDIVSLSVSGSVVKAATDTDIFGVCVSKNGMLAGVLFHGTVELEFTGTAPTSGFVKLSPNGSNKVTVSTGPNIREYRVLEVKGNKITIML